MQFGKSRILGYANDLPIGSGDTDGADLIEIPAGGAGLVITMVALQIGDTPPAAGAVDLKFWRRPVVAEATTPAQIAVTYNAGDGTGQTVATIPTTAAAGDVYRIYFGGDTSEGHVINPGESFAVEVDAKSTTASVNGSLTVHGYEFDVGATIPIIGGTTGLTGDQTKPNSGGSGNIINLIT